MACRCGSGFFLTMRILLLFSLALSIFSANTLTLDHPRWRTPLAEGGSPPSGIPVSNQGQVYFIYAGVQAYSADSGRLLWQAPVDSFLPAALLADRHFVFVVEKRVFASDRSTGKRAWEFSPDADASLCQAALDGNTLFFGTSSHKVYALNALDGHLLWTKDLQPGWQYPTVVRGVSIQNDTIYVALERAEDMNGVKSSGWVFAMKAKDGEQLWKFHTDGERPRQGASSAPVVGDKFVVVSDALDNSVFALDRRTGLAAWRFDGERGFAGSSQTPIIVGGRVYAISGDRYVYALAMKSGQLLWRTQMPASNLAAAVCGSSLLINFEGLAALDLSTGQVQKKKFSGNDEFVSSGFAVKNGRLFVAGPKAVYSFECR